MKHINNNLRKLIIEERIIQTINDMIVVGFYKQDSIKKEILESIKGVMKYYKKQIKIGEKAIKR